MQALFYASPFFPEVCGFLIFALFIRVLVLDFALSFLTEDSFVRRSLFVRIRIFQRTHVQ